MQCSLLRGLCLFCVILAICIVVILFTQASSCPWGTFRCENSSFCLPRRYLCDGHSDCPNGSDEDRLECTDKHGALDSFKDTLPPATGTPFQLSASYNSCALGKPFPIGCSCRNMTSLNCKHLNLDFIPQVDPHLTRLILENNTIRRISADNFSHYKALELIHLDGNGLEEIDPDTFHRQINLKRLFLRRNKLTHLHDKTFQGLSKLLWLPLEDNLLHNISFQIFRDLSSLNWLILSKNRLTIEDGNTFPYLASLKDLFLNDNNIQYIANDTFALLSNLLLLNLRNNSIKWIDEMAFGNLKRLTFLELSHNQLEYIPENLFQWQLNLSTLHLGFNPIKNLPAQLFLPLISLRSLNLHAIAIPNIQVEMFASAVHLDFVYFDDFYYCSYVPHSKKCHPNSDGVSSFDNLLGNELHRICLWIIATLTIMGNLVVLGGRGMARTENRILTCFVKNLAVSDLCIGIYLMCLGERDIHFRGQYNYHAHQWMTSWRCTALRILAVTTSEVSLLILAFMSIERFVSISSPFGERKLTFRTALISIIVIWLTGFALAAIPVFYWQESKRYHGTNSLCFPLHMHEPRALGWKYSSFLYIGINGCCVLVIVGVYTALFLSIRRTRHATPLAPNELEIAVRFFFIVFTDCLCWLPIIILKIIALFDGYITADLYAWVVVFILPVNSAINPFLYTFTTPTFRSAFREIFRRSINFPSGTNSLTLRHSLRESGSRNVARPQDSARCGLSAMDADVDHISMVSLPNSGRLTNTSQSGNTDISSKENHAFISEQS